jgi:hypothetical protein
LLGRKKVVKRELKGGEVRVVSGCGRKSKWRIKRKRKKGESVKRW